MVHTHRIVYLTSDLEVSVVKVNGHMGQGQRSLWQTKAGGLTSTSSCFIVGYSAVYGITCYDCHYERFEDGTEVGRSSCLTPSEGNKPDVTDCTGTTVPTDACVVCISTGSLLGLSAWQTLSFKGHTKHWVPKLSLVSETKLVLRKNDLQQVDKSIFLGVNQPCLYSVYILINAQHTKLIQLAVA